MTGKMPADEIEINATLVRRLLAEQFPQWADLRILPAEPQGWDNRTFRLGEELSVRLPSAEGYTPQIEKEHRWLPFLAPHLPLPIPVPLALGQPAQGFPWQWSIYHWLEGETARADRIENLTEFAISLAHFLTALQQIEATGGPPPGLHSAFRGGPLEFYAAEARQATAALKDEIEVEAVTSVLETALAAPWPGTPVWFHGDVAVGNLLVHQGQLSAVIDFGCAGVGDPACDAVIAWTFFSGASREAFRAAWPVGAATWARGRGWALWKALITLAEYRFTDTMKAAEARHVIHQVITDETE